ncbi:MAG: MFS transporter [Acidimicrobiales bacterium]
MPPSPPPLGDLPVSEWPEGTVEGASKRRLARFGGSTFSSLKYRNFRLFFSGQIISQVGNWLTLVAQTLLVLKLTNSGFMVGLLTACQFAPVLLFGAWAGLIADRSDKRKLLMIVQALAMVQSFALAALAFMGNPPVAAIFAVAFCGGIATAFDNPARRAFGVEMVPETNVQNAVSLNSALMTSSRIVGPALAGLLISTVGYGWCFTVDGVSYIAVLVALWMMRPADLRRPPVAKRGKGQVREGLRYVRTVPDLWIPLVMMGIIGTLAFNFQVVLPLFATRTFGGDDATFTLLLSVISAGSLMGALITARRKTIELRHVIVAAAGFGVAMLVLAAVPTLGLAFPVAMAMGFVSIAFMTASTAIVQVRSDPSMRGRVLALQAIVFLGSTPIGGPIVGAICQELGARAGLVVGGLAGLSAAAWGLFAGRRSLVDGASEPPDAVDEALELEALR